MADLWKRRIIVSITAQLPVPAGGRYAETTWTLDTAESDMRVDFRLREQASYPFPQGELKIYNLSTDTRNLLGNAARVKIQAGYETEEPLPLLFEGSVGWSESKYAGTDVVSNFLLGGRIELEQSVSASYEQPARMYDVARALVTQATRSVFLRTRGAYVSNLRVGEFRFERVPTEGRAGTVIESTETPPNYSISGQLGDALTTMFETKNLVWYVDETGVIRVIRRILPPDTPVHTLNKLTGMVGHPIVNRDGISVKHLLDARIKLRNFVRIQSETTELPVARYTPSELEHHGSNWSNNWYTQIQAIVN